MNYKNYPFGSKNLKLEEFHSDLEARNQIRANDRKNLPKIIMVVTAFIITSFIIILSSLSFERKTDYRALAGLNKVSFFLYPRELYPESDKDFKVTPKIVPENMEKKIASVLLALSFDPAKIRLLPLSQGSVEGNLKLLKSSPLETANSEGRIKIFYGAISLNDAPAGVVNLPEITFIPLIASGDSQISLLTAELQVAFTDKQPADISADTPIHIKFKMPATPTLAPTPEIPTVTPVPETILSPTPVPTIQETSPIPTQSIIEISPTIPVSMP